VLVTDNLNTRPGECAVRTFGPKGAGQVKKSRVRITPEHASWLNIAGSTALATQCLNRRIAASKDDLEATDDDGGRKCGTKQI